MIRTISVKGGINMDYTQFIKAELLILVAALYVLGAILKKANRIKDNYIPFILTGVGLVMSCLYVLGTEGISPMSIFTAIVQGLLCTGAAVLVNQYVKQSTKAE